MTTPKKDPQEKDYTMGLGNILGGLGSLIRNLGDLAEKAAELKKEHGEKGAGDDQPFRVESNFRVRTGMVPENSTTAATPRPFESAAAPKKKWREAPVHLELDPEVDVFDEDDHIRVVVELPGVQIADVELHLAEDILTLRAVNAEKSYRKEVLLPVAFSAERMTHTLRNGVLEIKLRRSP